MAGQGEQSRLQACAARRQPVATRACLRRGMAVGRPPVREEHDYDMGVILERSGLGQHKTPTTFSGIWPEGWTSSSSPAWTVCATIRATAAARTASAITRWTPSTTPSTRRANAAGSETDRWGIPAGDLPLETAGRRTRHLSWTMGLVMRLTCRRCSIPISWKRWHPAGESAVPLFASENNFRSLSLGNADYVAIGPTAPPSICLPRARMRSPS